MQFESTSFDNSKRACDEKDKQEPVVHTLKEAIEERLATLDLRDLQASYAAKIAADNKASRCQEIALGLCNRLLGAYHVCVPVEDWNIIEYSSETDIDIFFYLVTLMLEDDKLLQVDELTLERINDNTYEIEWYGQFKEGDAIFTTDFIQAATYASTGRS